MDIMGEILRILKIFRPWPGLAALAVIIAALFLQCAHDLLFGKKERKRKERDVAFLD